MGLPRKKARKAGKGDHALRGRRADYIIVDDLADVQTPRSKRDNMRGSSRS